MTKVAIYNPYLSTRGGGEKVCLALAESLQHDLNNDVYIISHDKDNLADLAHYFKLDLSGIKLIAIDMESVGLVLLRRLPLPGRIKNVVHDFKVSRTIKRGGYDVFINNCYQSNLPSPIKHGVYMCMFPQLIEDYPNNISVLKKIYISLARKISRLVLHPRHRSPIDTYEIITANSRYTQDYIVKLWDRESKILFPICENMTIKESLPKEKIILNVGRFFDNIGESHHKRADILLDTFAKAKKLRQDGWQLHFAGSVAEDVGTLKYILRLMEDARDLPVYFHFNASFKDLRKLYNQATIYWHATGFGSNQQKHPEKQEHFGISTVEAMSAGCIPIVIDSAGQKESVSPGNNGFLWSTQEELTELTYRVASMPTHELEAMADKARQGAKRFDSVAFRKNVEEIFIPEEQNASAT